MDNTYIYLQTLIKSFLSSELLYIENYPDSFKCLITVPGQKVVHRLKSVKLLLTGVYFLLI
jgi:hypothetical protein